MDSIEELIKKSESQHSYTECKIFHPGKKHAVWALDEVQNEFENNGEMYIETNFSLFRESKTIFDKFKEIHGEHSSDCDTCQEMNLINQKFLNLEKNIFVRKRAIEKNETEINYEEKEGNRNSNKHKDWDSRRIRNHNNRVDISKNFSNQTVSEIDINNARNKKIAEALKNKKEREEYYKNKKNDFGRKDFGREENKIKPKKNIDIVAKFKSAEKKEKDEEELRKKVNLEFIKGDPKNHIRKRTDPHLGGPSLDDLKRR